MPLPWGTFRVRRGKRTYTRKKKRSVTVATVKKVIARSLELKSLDTAVILELTTTPVVAELSAIVQGSNSFSRVGIRCNLKSLYVKWRFTADVMSADNVPQYIRMIFFRWDDDTAPTAGNILDATSVVNSHLDIGDGTGSSVSKYRIIKDYMFALCMADAGVAESVNLNRTIGKFYKKLKNTCVFDGSASTDGIKGRIWCLLMSSNATGANAPSIDLRARLRFTE